MKPSFTSPLAADLWSMFASPLRPLAQGVVYFHDQATQRALGRRQARATPSDSGVKWALLPRCSDAMAQRWALQNGMETVRTDSSYDCTGRYFARPVYIEHTSQGTLLRQSWGLDV